MKHRLIITVTADSIKEAARIVQALGDDRELDTPIIQTVCAMGKWETVDEDKPEPAKRNEPDRRRCVNCGTRFTVSTEVCPACLNL